MTQTAMSLAKQGEKNPMYGKKHREETIELMRENCPNPFPRGESHPNWKGGITESKKIEMGRYEYKRWRKLVKERDNHMCLDCGSEENLHADHIKPWRDYPELRYEVDNGRTLCFDCHKKTDSYGKNY